MYEEYGTFAARAVTGGALPVEGAIIRITGADEENGTVAYSLVTDLDGVTERIALPAPSRRLSMSPNSPEVPYALYDIEVTANGYYPKRIYGLTVFAGVDTLQIVDMIPGSQNIPEDYPRGNINAVIPENEIS